MANRSYTSHSNPAFGFSLLKGILVVILVMALLPAISQDVFFNKVTALPGKNFQHVTGIVQDKQGFMWLASKNGLFRYDGYQMIHYKNSSLNSKSLATAKLESIAVDSSGIIWIGTFDAGLDRFDPATGTFTHFRHDPNDPASLSGDTVSVVLCDRDGFIWVGAKTLDRLDPKTNKFTHYRNDPGDPLSISSNEIRAIYEDRSGELWIGTGTVYGEKRDDPQEGGLNKLNKKTGKFTRYKHDPKNPNSLATNKVRAIFEDSKGNFWVGTSGDGLHSMNRATGEFRRHHFDPAKPDKLSRPRLGKNFPYDHITFIHEDVSGALWIGTAESGINHYDTRESKLTHFESARDTAGSFTDRTTWWAYSSRDGVLWISTLHGTLYRVDPTRTKIPFYPVDASGVTSIYEEPDHTLWIGTGKSGLIQMDKNGNTIKKFIHNPADPASCSSNDISCIEGDREGHLWIGTFGSGLNLFDKQRGSFKRFMAGQNGAKHLSNNMALVIYDAGEEDIWIGTFRGLNRMNKKTGKFRHYLFYPNEKEETGTNVVTSVLKDKYSKWWAGSWEKGGLQQFDPESGRFKTYLKGADILNIFEDHSGVLWISGTEGVFRYNRQLDSFYRFEDPLFLTGNIEVRNFLEDGQGDLWLGTTAGIIRINRDRNETTLFGKNY
ncbi:MAG TPA: two-component regulator propeller domain-containing protein, partial [Chitinophagaceae bacterium]|nr:two-component regulator propeller domain-containing protein [Chitinophagaceae bacterium]